MNDLTITEQYKNLNQFEEDIKNKQNNIKHIIDVACMSTAGILTCGPISWILYSLFISGQAPLLGGMVGIMISSVIPGFIGAHSDDIAVSIKRHQIEDNYRFMFQKMCEDTEELCDNLTPQNYTLQEAFDLINHFWDDNFPKGTLFESDYDNDEQIISELKEKLMSRLFAFSEFSAAHMMIYALWTNSWENNELQDSHMPLRPRQDSLADAYKRAYNMHVRDFLQQSLPSWHSSEPGNDLEDKGKHFTYRLLMQKHVQDNYKQIIQFHYNMVQMFPIYEKRMDSELENEFRAYFNSITLP